MVFQQETHTQLGDFKGKNTSSEGHPRWNPWRRYSFNHRPSGHPARSYMLRWGHLLGTRVSSRYDIREVPWMLYFQCSICHCNRHNLRQCHVISWTLAPPQGRRRRYMGHNLDAWLLTRSHPAIPELSQAANNLTSLGLDILLLHVPRRPTDQALSHLIRQGFSWHAILGTRKKGGNCLIAWVI